MEAAEFWFLDSKPVWEVSKDPEILAVAVAVFLLLLSNSRGRAILRLEFSNTQLNSIFIFFINESLITKVELNVLIVINVNGFSCIDILYLYNVQLSLIAKVRALGRRDTTFISTVIYQLVFLKLCHVVMCTIIKKLLLISYLTKLAAKRKIDEVTSFTIVIMSLSGWT